MTRIEPHVHRCATTAITIWIVWESWRHVQRDRRLVAFVAMIDRIRAAVDAGNCKPVWMYTPSWAAHLVDNPSVREIYVDRDMTRWHKEFGDA